MTFPEASLHTAATTWDEGIITCAVFDYGGYRRALTVQTADSETGQHLVQYATSWSLNAQGYTVSRIRHGELYHPETSGSRMSPFRGIVYTLDVFEVRF